MPLQIPISDIFGVMMLLVGSVTLIAMSAIPRQCVKHRRQDYGKGR